MKRVLFACVENSNRSQMAEAFARMHGGGVLDPVSAGSRPSGVVNPRAIRAMAELGYDLAAHASKGLDVVEGPFDYVITMGCGEECPYVAAERREDWALADPKDLPPEAFNEVRDEIQRRVRGLIAELDNRGRSAMEKDWTELASFASLVEAEIAGGRLESADIPYFIDQRDAVGIFGPGFSGGSVRGVGLRVPSDFAEDAREALDLEPADGDDDFPAA